MEKEVQIDISIPEKITERLIEKLIESGHFSQGLIDTLCMDELSNVDTIKQILLNQEGNHENTKA